MPVLRGKKIPDSIDKPNVEVSFEKENWSIDVNGNILEIKHSENLEYNREYDIVLNKIESSEDNTLPSKKISFNFTTIFYPTFTTPKIIRLSEGIGPLISEISDYDIWCTILNNSINSIKIYGNPTFDWNDPPWCVINYVTLKTVLDLLTVGAVSRLGAGSKRLGPLDIEAPDGMDSLQDIRADIISRVRDAQKWLRKRCEEPVAGSAVIGGNTAESIQKKDMWKRWVDENNPEPQNVEFPWKSLKKQKEKNE